LTADEFSEASKEEISKHAVSIFLDSIRTTDGESHLEKQPLLKVTCWIFEEKTKTHFELHYRQVVAMNRLVIKNENHFMAFAANCFISARFHSLSKDAR
jgi:hypothetical protein